MKETTLELTVTIKADESTLRDIQKTLSSAESNRPPLADVLTVMIEQTLVAGGITDDFEIGLEHSHITLHHREGGALRVREWEGGLSAREWMETQEISEHITGGQDIQEADYED